MKPKKKKQKRNKPGIVPEFCELNSPHEWNEGLAEYGDKLGRRQDVIKLYHQITEWRKQLPATLDTLRKAGCDASKLPSVEANASARIAWCKMFEDAIVKPDADFFEEMAALIRHKSEGTPKKHPGEFEAWREFTRLLQASVRLSKNGEPESYAPPTKGQIKAAVKKNGIQVTSWPRIFKRLKLEWLPKEKKRAGRAELRIK